MNAPDTVGLTEREAAQRLARDGPNEIPSLGQRNNLKVALDILSEPMFALLMAASLIYVVLGDLTEAIALSLFATFSVSIALVQEIRSERVLAALRDLSSPRALVVRDGRRRRIPGREVVRDDVIVLAEGDRVPADAWIVSGHDLSVDESLLTGESAPVRKHPAPNEPIQLLRPGGDDMPCAFSGTLIVRGHGKARVVATGAASEIGKIGGALGRIRVEAPRLQSETRRIVRAFALVGAIVSVTAGSVYGLARASWLDGLLSGIAVGMSMLPEEFPLVLAVFMVMGAWRIAQARVLTRRAASIETLGAVTVLCTDKTGTLTENNMRLVHAATSDDTWEPSSGALSPEIQQLLKVATLAGLQEPFDPMERALQDVWRRQDATLASVFGGRELMEHQGVCPERLAMLQVWRESSNGSTLTAAKGAPEAIAKMCGLAPDAYTSLLRRAGELAARGMRVLAIATLEGHDLASSAGPFRLLGLAGFEDPIRASVPSAVEECRTAGIRVMMITGDYPATAKAIAQKAGIHTAEVTTGDELQGLDAAALRARIKTCDVFARILPEQKLRIVEALKANGEVVGMTGDGVNDAPSLRAAHIGIAMGGRGTDVAREASSIVLLDDDFGSIVETIRLGRRIYDNLQKAMGYIVSVHVPIAGLALLPLILGGPLILTPVLIALLEMIIDPACSILFEAEPAERDVMKRPPRTPTERLLDRNLVVSSLTLGVLALATVGLVIAIAAGRGGSDTDLRTLVFVSLVTTNVGLIFAHRSLAGTITDLLNRPNPLLGSGVAAIAAIMALIFAVPAARDALHFAPVHLDDMALSICAAIAFLVAAWGLRQFPKLLHNPQRKA